MGIWSLSSPWAMAAILQAFHDRIAVLHAIAQAAGGGVDDDPIHGHAQVFQQNIDLLGQVDVDGRGELMMAWP
jgi:hypothetical protein